MEEVVDVDFPIPADVLGVMEVSTDKTPLELAGADAIGAGATEEVEVTKLLTVSVPLKTVDTGPWASLSDGLGAALVTGTVDGAGELEPTWLRISLALEQTLSGPELAKNAATIFSPVTPESPHARFTAGSRACNASTQLTPHCDPLKSTAVQPLMGSVYTASHEPERLGTRGVKSSKLTATAAVGNASSVTEDRVMRMAVNTKSDRVVKN